MKDVNIEKIEKSPKVFDRFLVSEDNIEVKVSYISMKYDTPGDGPEADGRNDSSVED